MDLAMLLLQGAHNGIYHLPPAGLKALEEGARGAKLTFFRCDLRDDPALDHALVALGQACQLPDWYGANLDALHDCLTDFSWRSDTGWVLAMSGCDALQSMDSDGFDALTEVLTAVAEYWREQEIPFWVFFDMRANSLACLPSIR